MILCHYVLIITPRILKNKLLHIDPIT